MEAEPHSPRLPTPRLARIESKQVLKSLTTAHRALGALKGFSECIADNQAVQNALMLLEARESAAIEGIDAGIDDIFIADASASASGLEAARSTLRCRDALALGSSRLQNGKEVISEETLIEMHRLLTGGNEGYRSDGTIAGMKGADGRVFHRPPRNTVEIRRCIKELLHFVNGDAPGGLDPLVKAAAVHHRFLSIHPFTTGTGRIARALLLLQLVQAKLVAFPLPAASASLHAEREGYRRHFEAAAAGDWEEWTLYMVRSVAEAADATLALARAVTALIRQTGRRMQMRLPKLFSAGLLDDLFRQSCMQIESTMENLGVTRVTASKYLNALARHGFVERRKLGKNACFLNTRLIRMLACPKRRKDPQRAAPKAAD